MRYLLDTNVWIHYLKYPDSPVQARLRRYPAADIAVAPLYGQNFCTARKYEKRDVRIARVEQALRPYVSLPFDDAATRHYAEIRDDLGGEVKSSDQMTC